ncbi:MAG: malectin domain-containing carbohydrate-binding protein, partial [Paracoccaceae bacterium]
ILGSGVNIEVTADQAVGSVVFYLDGVAVRTESVAPYAMFGDQGGDFGEGDLTEGAHTLTVEFFSGGGGSGASVGTETISFVVGEAEGRPTDPVDGTPNDLGDPVDDIPAGSDDDTTGGFVFALNAGGAEFTSSSGITYQADTFGVGGAFTTGAAISGTEDDILYQSETWGQGGFTYDIALDNGTYDVELNFAEIWGGAASAGQRVFDVFVEGNLVVDDLDISGAVGLHTAADLIGQVEVTDGALTITTSAEVQNPKISGFSVWEATGQFGEAFEFVGDREGSVDQGDTVDRDDTTSADEAAWRLENNLTDENNNPDHAYYIAYNPEREIRGEHGGTEPIPSNDPGNTILAEWADQIVFQFDGNNNDEDDISALPVSALLALSGEHTQDKTTTFFYGNNIAEGTNEEQHKELTDGARFADALGIETIDVQADADAAVARLAGIYNSGEKILSIEGGPMEIVYQALELTDEANLENIWLVSHSTWNEKYPQIEANKPQDTRSWFDVANDFPSLKMTDIFDQNGNQDPDAQYDNQNWADFGVSDDPILRAARDVMEGAGKLKAGKEDDASDAGMMWYALTGDERGDAQEAIAQIEAFDFEFEPGTDLSFIEDPDVLALFS